MKWIKSIDKGSGSIGLTFERNLNKKPDSTFFPDYAGIEIKCTTRYSRFPLSLLSLAFEGPTYPEINRILSLYGYPDYKYRNKNVLKVDVSCGSIKKCGNYKFALYLDEIENKIYLEVYDLEDNLLERKSFLYLDSFLKHIKLKLSLLAIIKASKKVIDEETYFRYYKFTGYKLVENSKIIELLKNGTIFATLESRVGKSSYNSGKYKNKNLVFKINKEDINKLFIKINELDTDYNSNKVFDRPTGFYIMP